MKRILGPFCRDFFVPWEHIKVVRTTVLFSSAAKLQFGNPVVGTLTIPTHVANRLARAAMGRWPEPGPFPEETRGDIIRRLLTEYAFGTVMVVLFLTFVPMATVGVRPPLTATVVFPMIFFGGVFLVRFLAGKG
jgi:hypothetical protein